MESGAESSQAFACHLHKFHLHKFLQFQQDDDGRQILALRDAVKEGSLVPRRTQQIISGNIAEINFLIACCEIIDTYKNGSVLDTENIFKTVKAKKEFSNLFQLMNDKFESFGFSQHDIQVLAFAQHCQDELLKKQSVAKRMQEVDQGAQSRPRPAPRSSTTSPTEKSGDPPIRVPVRRAPSPPLMSSSMVIKKEDANVPMSETGTRPKTKLTEARKELLEKELAQAREELYTTLSYAIPPPSMPPPPSWTPPWPPVPQRRSKITANIKRPTHPPPPPPKPARRLPPPPPPPPSHPPSPPAAPMVDEPPSPPAAPMVDEPSSPRSPSPPVDEIMVVEEEEELPPYE